MFTGVVISFSVILQFLSAIFSLRLIKTTGFRLSWLLISMSILLMGFRRLIALYDVVLVPGSSLPASTFELVGLVTSCLMLSGVIMIGPLFKSMRQNEEKLSLPSITDDLTGLHNRRGLDGLYRAPDEKGGQGKDRIFLLYADLDGMKAINDSSGHQEGDQALKDVAEILRQTYRKSDIIARVGGDEFVVVPVGFERDDVARITRRLQKHIDEYNSVSYSKFKLSLSVGISFYDTKAPCSVDELISEADRLMYEQKKKKIMGMSSRPDSSVIPAKAGIQGLCLFVCHSERSRGIHFSLFAFLSHK